MGCNSSSGAAKPGDNKPAEKKAASKEEVIKTMEKAAMEGLTQEQIATIEADYKEKEAKILEVWDDKDTDKSGKLNYEEARASLASVLRGVFGMTDISDENLKAMFDKMDVDGSKDLSKQEFCQMVRIGWFRKHNQNAAKTNPVEPAAEAEKAA